MTRRRGLLHVNLNVSSLDRSLRFYCEGLGFELRQENEEQVDFGGGAGTEPLRQAILTTPGCDAILALTEARSLAIGAGGLNHLGLVVEDDAACGDVLDRVEVLGGSIGKKGTRDEAGVSEAFAYVRDPDGYAIEVSTQAILYASLGAADATD